MNPQSLAIELVRVLNQGDADTALHLFLPDAEVCFPRFAPRSVFRGDGELRELFAWLTARLPVQTLAVDRVSATETTALVEFEITGVSDTGHEFDNVGALVVDTEQGRIARLRCYIDTADLGRILAQPIAA
jgi:ketosteroid isomerase-like protein